MKDGERRAGWTRADILVQPESAPLAEQRGQQRTETADPIEGDHQYQMPSFIDGIQYSGATVAFLGPTHRFLCSYDVLHGDSVLMF